MKNQIGIAIVALMAIAALTPCRASDDFQVWLYTSIQTDLEEDWSLTVSQEAWFTDDAGTHRLQNLDVGITHKTKPFLRLGMNLREQIVRIPGGWLNETRLHGHATFLWKWKSISFADRNRLEGRFREKRDDLVRYRNRLKVTFAPVSDSLDLRPYLFNEIFIDSDQGEYNQNRLAAGLQAKIHPHMTLSTYYLLQSVDQGSWDQRHVIGLSLAGSF